ncbi:MAG: NAD-dependent epimerase/dehydratase [Devosia sp.]|jgi:nucleoside-diphosphate-sugar epimerase|nr:NAD-dependent epimerase/dehydratase [Devosia sp.]
MSESRIVVTGAAGFLGGAVLQSLQNSGRPVLGLDIVAANGVRICDVADQEALIATLTDVAVEAIIHCGAVSGPMLHRERPHFVASANIAGTLNLLEHARVNRMAKFVFCSSASVYGPQPNDQLVDEDAPLHPSSAYGASKVAGEALVDAYRAAHGVNGTSLRIAAIYGPGRRTACHIRDMLLALQQDRSLHIKYGADQRFHYVHLTDAVEAVQAALDHPGSLHSAFTIAGDHGITLRDLAALVERTLHRSGISVGSARDPDLDEQGPFALDRAAADLGWRPRVPLSEGIASYAAVLASDVQKS